MEHVAPPANKELLAAFALTVPVSSVHCERDFSTMNRGDRLPIAPSLTADVLGTDSRRYVFQTNRSKHRYCPRTRHSYISESSFTAYTDANGSA
ncbi:hypothetical protein EYF80_032639 [Liparis tanakae]|uniref:Uncharacterized protein n=1 Tax=Liparis tanakae TaxID=230148 RepID=A0A4Z2GUD5_9TELE|nr:hypothetical protein EYF80_032639 [Liparis tanakae]